MTAGGGSGGESQAPRWRAPLGAALLLLLLAYLVLVYYGFGPHPKGLTALWWQPRAFFRNSGLVGWLGGNSPHAIAALSAPAFLLAAAAIALCRTSLARTFALWAALSTALFLFYGLRAPGIWRFLSWRGTAAGLGVTASVAVALLAPLLASSWLRLGWPLRLATYVPLGFVVVAVERNATGTNPALPFSVSPWPAVPVFGFDGGASAVAGALGCLALMLGAWRLRTRSRATAFAALAAVGTAAAAWAVLGSRGGILPLGTAVVLGALAMAVAALLSANLGSAMRSAAGCVALGGILVALPIGVGRAWVRLDYAATRTGRAQEIIHALAAYQKKKDVFPDSLSELVKAGDLKRVPEPSIGFTFLGRAPFSYENFGNDYLLEFSAPGWVQCAYTPPWDEGSEESGDAGEEGGGAASGGSGESLPGSWSCPSKPPELW